MYDNATTPSAVAPTRLGTHESAEAPVYTSHTASNSTDRVTTGPGTSPPSRWAAIAPPAIASSRNVTAIPIRVLRSAAAVVKYTPIRPQRSDLAGTLSAPS